MNHTPLYAYSRETAWDSQELTLWQESHDANIDCAKAIQSAIHGSMDGQQYRPDPESARHIIDAYGFNRVNWVLATSLQQVRDDRVSRDNREWAKGFYADYRQDEMKAYRVNAHPAALGGFVDQARQAWRELKLFDHTHCEPDSRSQDYDGKVLALRPTVLKDEYKTPQDQLFYCKGGFGASPDASGRTVFGEFLTDGEQTNFDRADFLGVLKEEHMPDWALEKLEQLRQPEPEQNLSQEEPSL